MFKIISKNRVYLAILCLLSAIILFINSPFSPLRDINYLDYDSTIFYIIGKGIKYNYIPYINLIDHKGVYIFMLNYLGVLICESHNLGMFIVQFLVICLSIISIFNLSLFITKDSILSFLSTLTMIILQNSYYFSQGGLKCETFLMPFMFFTIYLFLKDVTNEPKQVAFSKSMFLIGVCAGIVMMTKANMLLCFIPIIIYYLKNLFVDKNIKKIFILFVSGLLGVSVGVAPAIIYCLINNNLYEMINYSFGMNFTYLNDLQYYFHSYLDAIVNIILFFSFVILASIFSIIAFYRLLMKKNLLFFYIPFVILSLIAAFMALRPYSYHASILLPSIYFSIVFIYDCLKKLIVEKNKWLKPIYIILVLFLVLFSYHISWKNTEKNHFGQYVVAKKIHNLCLNDINNSNVIDNSSMLVVGACINLYNELNILPNIRYFCTPYISRSLYSEPYDEIIESISEKRSEFVAISFTKIMIKDGFNDEVRQALKNGYTLVGDVAGLDAEFYKRR